MKKNLLQPKTACQIVNLFTHRKLLGGPSQVLDAIRSLCQQGVELKLASLEVSNDSKCAFCSKPILRLTHLEDKMLDCGHEIHRPCLRMQLELNCQLRGVNQKIPAVQCGICKNRLSEDLIRQVIGESDLSTSFYRPYQQPREPSPEPVRPPPPPPVKKRIVQPSIRCEGCQVKQPASALITLECLHRFCQDCFQATVHDQSSVDATQFVQPVCPIEQCSTSISQGILMSNIPEQMQQKIEDKRLQRTAHQYSQGIFN